MTTFRVLADSVFLALAATPDAVPSPLMTATTTATPGGIADILNAIANNPIMSGLIGTAIVTVGTALVRYLRSRAARRNEYWVAAETLLRETLFDELPDAFRADLIGKILTQIAAKTEINITLFRATRLFVEARLLRPGVDESGKPIRPSTVKEEFAKLKRVTDPILALVAQDPAQVKFENCFELAALCEGVGKYFRSLMKLANEPPLGIKPEIPDPELFITPIRVVDGFVAPSFLVAGLLQQFNEDWQNALRYFNDTLEDGPEELVLVQRFQFFCWLLWGPSIPACTCARWRGEFIALQYGYGDEDNSFPLLIENVDESKAKISSELTRDLASDGEHAPLAFGSDFVGRFAWGPRYGIERSQEYPRIYWIPAPPGPPETPKYLKLGNHHVSAMEGVALLGSFTPASAPRRYYSAYLWIMFQVSWDDKPPPASNAADRWKTLFPVFEHTNVAHGLTLSFVKERLAEKVIATVNDLENSVSGRPRFRYLCATDDPGDVSDGLNFGEHRSLLPLYEGQGKPLRNEIFKNGGQPDVDAMTGEEKHRLRSILYQKLLTPEARTRMFEPAPPGSIITACDLPQIINEFYQRLPDLK